MKHLPFKKRLELIEYAEDNYISEAENQGVKPTVEFFAKLAGFGGKRPAQCLHNWARANGRSVKRGIRVR